MSKRRPRLAVQARPGVRASLKYKRWLGGDPEKAKMVGHPLYSEIDGRAFFRFLRRSVREGMAPTKAALPLTDDQIISVFRLAQQGMTISQLCYVLGYTPRDMKRKMEVDQRIRWAFMAGRAHALKYVTHRLMDKIHAGNPSCIIFYLKSQANWTEKYTIGLERELKDIAASEDPTVLEQSIKAMSSDDMRELIAMIDRIEKRKQAFLDAQAKGLPPPPIDGVEDAQIVPVEKRKTATRRR